MMQKNPVALVAFILVLVGAINWGLVGLGKLVSGENWNVVTMLLGSMPKVEAVVYVLVGLAGLYKIVVCSKGCGSDGCCK